MTVPVETHHTERLRWAVVALAVLVALLAALIVGIQVRGAGRDRKIGELACALQQAGGRPVAGATCPPAVFRTPDVVVTVPDGGTVIVPQRPPRPAETPRTGPVVPTPAPATTRPAKTGTASPRISATRTTRPPSTTPPPTPLVCITGLPCIPPIGG